MTLAESMIAELEHEASGTRRALERVPEDRLSWRPHPKSMSLGQLALHIAQTPAGVARLVDGPEGEAPDFSGERPEAESRAELLEELDQSVALAAAKLADWGDRGLGEEWRLTRDGETLMAMPRVQMVRSVMFNHVYHHRGQLLVYLRLLDHPVPAIYGDSADEEPSFA